jgi:aminoglycoside phosphotransferase family enzyme
MASIVEREPRSSSLSEASESNEGRVASSSSLSEDEVKGQHTIVKKLDSSATVVYFLRTSVEKPFCVKLWKFCEDEHYSQLCNTEDNAKNMGYILDGFYFNRKHGAEVYLGIAQKIAETKTTLKLGRLIRDPRRDNLDLTKEYAVVMGQLEDSWRLDVQLRPEKYGNSEGMNFLARAIATMHGELDSSPAGMGNAEMVGSKLGLNKKLFEKALQSLFAQVSLSAKQKAAYAEISRIMEAAYSYYVQTFEQRYQDGHIKRCHGDLKASNLWIRPPREFIALDCVDFEPAFCHIDTLSDVAMLAIDLRAQLRNHLAPLGQAEAEVPMEARAQAETRAELLTDEFVQVYLEESAEQGKVVEALLEYYMTEKAMIFAYIWLLVNEYPFDQPIRYAWGRYYMDVACSHAARLQETMPVSQAGVR